MRFLIISFLTLFIFTANQAAIAYDACCETPTKREASQAAAHDHSNHSHDHGEKKSDRMADHCAMNGHHSLADVRDNGLSVPMRSAADAAFGQPLFHELQVAEGLIEPPSIA